MELPPLDDVARHLHEEWVKDKLLHGILSRLSAENNEELMVPYAELSEHGKELNRAPVRQVYAAIIAWSAKQSAPAQDRPMTHGPHKL